MSARLGRTLRGHSSRRLPAPPPPRCGGDSGDASGSGKTTLVVKTFSQFGYDELLQGVRGRPPRHQDQGGEHRASSATTLPKLQQWMATGSGAGDVVALEEGILSKFMAQARPVREPARPRRRPTLKGNFLEWKWKQALTPDGKKLVGLGTDVGAQGMCYRTDLFAKAGLPTDREKVGELWPTWDAYLATGKRFAAARTGAELLRLRRRRLPEHPDAAGRPHVLRPRRTSCRRHQPRRQDGLGPDRSR